MFGSFQQQLTGAGISSQVAADARVGTQVMLRHYAREEEIAFRERSNRTYERILNAVSPEVANRYGYEESAQEKLEYQLNQARQAKDWKEVNRLAESLNDLQKPEGV